MAIRFRYLVPDGTLRHEGVPARDLGDEDVAALTQEQKAIVEGSHIYEAVEPPKRTDVKAPEKEGGA